SERRCRHFLFAAGSRGEVESFDRPRIFPDNVFYLCSGGRLFLFLACQGGRDCHCNSYEQLKKQSVNWNSRRHPLASASECQASILAFSAFHQPRRVDLWQYGLESARNRGMMTSLSGVANVESSPNALGISSDRLVADRAVVLAELLLLRHALRRDLRASTDAWADACVGASLLVVVGGTGAGDFLACGPLPDRSRALVTELYSSHPRVRGACDRSSRDLPDHWLAVERRGLSKHHIDTRAVLVGHSFQSPDRFHELRHDLSGELRDRLLPAASGRGAEDLESASRACAGAVAFDRSAAPGTEDAASPALPLQYAEFDFSAAL